MEELSSVAPKGNFGIQLIFIFFGIASLLGWNALLTKLDFFNKYLEGMKPSTSFSFLNFILNIFFQLFLIIKKDLFSLKCQLITGIIGSIFFLIAIPLSTMLITKELLNYFITGGLVVLMGIINALASGGFFNYVSYFPLKYIVSFSAGQGFSGITMNILEYLVLIFVGGSEQIILRAWIFFGVSSFILLVCLIILLFSYNSEFSKYYLSKRSEIPEGSLVDRESLINEEEGITTDKENTDKNKNIKANSIKESSNFIILFKKIWDLDLLMVYIYIITFALFPNASIGQKLFNLGDYNSNTIILIYNVGDTIGRYLVRILPNTKTFNYIICFNRTFLLFTLIFNFYCQDGLELDLTLTSILLIVNVLLLALTNGIGTTLCFGIAPNQVEDEYKGVAGTSLSFFLIVGICLGSCVNFGVEAIISLFRKKPLKK
jgi:equilibrative nucleoside transporter 1/2/3